MIYAYTTPGVSYHDGWIKIGYTEQDVTNRIKQQTHTAGIRWELQWKKNALFDDGSGRSFRDSDFHNWIIYRSIGNIQPSDCIRIYSLYIYNSFPEFVQNIFRRYFRNRNFRRNIGKIRNILRLDILRFCLNIFRRNFRNSFVKFGKYDWYRHIRNQFFFLDFLRNNCRTAG